MKRFFICIFICLIIITSVCGCNMPYVYNGGESTDDSEKLESIYDQGMEAAPPELTEEELSKLSQIVEIYKSNITSRNIFNYISSGEMFALVDVNQDGVLEVAIRENHLVAMLDHILFCDMESNRGYIIITVPGYDMMKDGCVLWKNQSPFRYGGRRFTSLKDCEYIELYKIVDDEYVEYYIDGKSVTEEEFDKYIDSSCTERIKWYDLTEENIEKYISVEAFLDESYFCSCHKND